MDERAKIPVSLPRDNPTQSYWQVPPDDIADLRTTPHLPGSADVVIVGSGITGAAVAWNLLQDDNGTSSDSPGTVVMLEARQACSGATGRNGQLIPHASPFPRDAAGPRRPPGLTVAHALSPVPRRPHKGGQLPLLPRKRARPGRRRRREHRAARARKHKCRARLRRGARHPV